MSVHRYADTFWDDVQAPSSVFVFAGGSDPTLGDFQPGGSGTTFKVREFAKNDEVFGVLQLPHRYSVGENFEAHVHWTPRDRGAAEGAGVTVGWKLDYSVASIGSAFPASSTVAMTGTCTGTDDLHELADGAAALSGTGVGISAIMLFRLYRSDTGADDTWAGATAATSPALLEFDLHIPIDSPGSEQEYVKYEYRP